MVLDEEPVSRGREDFAGAFGDLEREFEAHDQGIAALVLGHPLLPRLITGGCSVLGVRQAARRLVEQRADGHSLHGQHG